MPELDHTRKNNLFPSEVNMAIDLKTNSAGLSKAWQDIFDDKCETDW